MLVVRFSAIGDCIMVAWAVTAMRNKWPGANIVWAVQKRSAPVIDDVHLVNEARVFDRERWKKTRWSPRTWREQLVAYAGLRRLRFDYGLDFQGHSKTALCLRLAAPKTRLAARCTDAFARRLNPVMAAVPETPHEMDRNFTLIRQIGDFVEPDKPLLPEWSAERAWVRERLPEKRPLVTLQTGAGHHDKTYPADRWSAVAAALIERGCSVVALGGPGDPHIACEGLVDWVGTCDLATSIAAVGESDLHVAADTGTGHAAAALGVPSVSVYGPMHPDQYHPWSDKAVVLYKGRDPRLVSPIEVIEAAVQVLEARPRALFD